MKSNTHDPACECEHISHFGVDEGGNASERAGHAYGEAPATQTIQGMGVCDTCFHTCLKEFA